MKIRVDKEEAKVNKQFNSKPVFIFEMANNHSGSVEQGLNIMKKVYDVAQKFRDSFDFGFKLQYRHLDTFIHPDFQERHDLKYVKRFLDTRLNPEQFKRLKDEMKALNFISVCTPFDEKSVDLIEEHDFDIIKIASCSFTDWPLLERIVKSSKPIIASTAGALLEDIDKVVSFFGHRGKQISLMHCVAEYPTVNSNLQLNQIDLLKSRYPSLRIGFSTHENPANFEIVKLAVAKGATIFEKHVGVPTESIKLNDYSANPEQIEKWLGSALEAFEMCGVIGRRLEFTESEKSSLMSLRRGVFAKRKIHQGEKIDISDTFMAIPTTTDQLTANDMSKYTIFYAAADISPKQPILFENTNRVEIREKIYDVMQKIKSLLQESKVVVPHQLDFEISHHYGIDKFDEFGATIINYLNREYCKKLIVILPEQVHPEQYHKQKEETFIILYGDVQITLDGKTREGKPGDIVTVERGIKHSFTSQKGAVIEEISSTHYRDDSYYTDPAIASNPNRKTLLTYWVD
jgi:sialic acid synthase SpsE/mannose-6-phosphate isomerase-like protein (cupin superfamily)